VTHADWIAYHATLFGFHASELPMLEAWAVFFIAEGFAAAELQAASLELARNERPAFRREDHLNLIGTAVRAGRRQVEKSEPPKPGERGDCALCGGTGWACCPPAWRTPHWMLGYPHPKYLYGKTGGQWFACALFCACPLGRWKHAHWDAKNYAVPMTLDAYEREFPDWMNDLAWHGERVQKAKAAVAVTRERDAALGELPGRLARKLAADLAASLLPQRGEEEMNFEFQKLLQKQSAQGEK
jgi:hypothetical protein